MIRRIKIEANLQWILQQDARTGRYVAECVPLRLSMGGDTEAELHENINEALDLLFASLIEDGQFDQFLHDHGWRAKPTSATAGIDMRNVRVTVPWELVSAKGNADGHSSRARH